MRRIRIPAQLLIGVIIILSIITFLYDAWEYQSTVTLQPWNYIHETLIIAIILLYYLFLKDRQLFNQPSVHKNLRNFIILLAILYSIIFIFKLALAPQFSLGTFPYRPETFSSVVFSNVISLAAIFTLLPLLILVRNLIYYRHKKRTRLYFSIAVILTAINIGLTVAFELPLTLEFTGETTILSSVFLFTLIFLMLLSLRNSWITYLSRKEKQLYFLSSVFLAVIIILLYGYGFEQAVPAHSLALGAFITIGHWFLVFYAIMSCAYLLIQLPTAKVFDRKMREVSSLHNLSRAIAVEFDYGKLLSMVTEMASEVIESNYTWLEIMDSNSGKLSVAASKNLDSDEINKLNSGSAGLLSQLIVENKKSIVVNDVSKSDFYSIIHEWKKNVNSFVGVPLTNSKGYVIGILYSAKRTLLGFDPDDVNMLEAYANQAAIALENAQLLKSSLERERMEKELQIAREVQLRLLPQQNPRLKNLQIETLTITAYEVGGDYYDFYSSNNSYQGLIIGDVSGKGTSAAFYMAEAKGIIQSLASSYHSPREILINTNRILYNSIEKKSFISLLAAQIDLKSNIIKFARAGHCPVIYYSAGEKRTRKLQPGGIAVGLEKGTIFNERLEESALQLHCDDILVFYTDGLSEARNSNEEEFGEDRLCTLIAQNASLSAEKLKEMVIDNIMSFLDGENLHDDLTLILIKIQ